MSQQHFTKYAVVLIQNVRQSVVLYMQGGSVYASVTALHVLHSLVQVVLQAEADDITWLSQQLATLANSSSCSSRTPVPDAEALQVLEQQADDLDIQLRRCARGCLYSTSSISKATDLMAAARQYVDAGLMRDLAQLGAAVAAALPCKHFCNNPECLNCVRLSENELVGGKGSVCSGCKVARYCMKECQLAHWKQHKAACKQLQGQSSAGKKK